MKKGSAKSIRSILKNIADSERIDFQILVVRYLHERLLYRVAKSEYANNFVLKGGLLLYVIEGLHIRPTKDIDMLARKIINNKEQIKQIFQSICNVKYDDDCVFFDIPGIETAYISEKDKYMGVRVFVKTGLDTIRQRLQIDIGFSDVITPAPINLSYPVLINELKTPEIKAYSIETVIAEKFHAMIEHGIFNSRMKDFYDVYILLKNNKIKNTQLQSAICQTFKQRNAIFDDNHPLFTSSFYENPNRQTIWKAFLRKMKLSENLEFQLVVKSILERLQPIYNDLSNEK